MHIVKKRHDEYPKSPAVGRCDCGCYVVLGNFTNSCGCGREYNSFGQRLADRRYWGEETGEHPTDIANLTGWEEW